MKYEVETTYSIVKRYRRFYTIEADSEDEAIEKICDDPYSNIASAEKMEDYQEIKITDIGEL